MFYIIPALTLITAASNADVTILRLGSSASASGLINYLLADGELEFSVKLPYFSTLIAPNGF